MNPKFRNICFTLLLSLVSVSVAARNAPPETSIEGLELVEKDRRGEIYAEPGVDWSQYTQINLEEASVSFRKNWKRDQNRYDPFKVRDQDIDKIKSGLSQLFDEVFTEELTTNGGYTMSDSVGPEVMTLAPRIVDLDIAAPDTNRPGITTTYTEQAGRMTLILEIFDSQSGDMIAKVSHRQDAPRYNQMRWTNSVTNSAEARRMLQRWASGLVERLDEARAITSATE